MDPLSLLFPRFCCGCQKIGSFLCDSCREKITFLPFPITAKLDSVYLDGLQAMATYEEPLTSLIHELKYKHVKEIGTLCGQLLYLHTHYPLVDIVTCTPLHPKRQQDRGYNQAEVISQEFARWSRIPFVPLLVKQNPTLSQATLSTKDQRLTNLKHAFSINHYYQKHYPPPSTVLLIDDVITTGTTLNICAQVLKQWGVYKVYGLAVAHGF